MSDGNSFGEERAGVEPPKPPLRRRFSSARRLGARPIRPRMRGLSLNRMVPNIITLLALCAGMTAIRFAIAGKFESAVAAILFAGVMDGLDGKLARLLKASSKLGAELDSLSDFVSFGVAPAIVLHTWSLDRVPGIGWVVAMLYGVCMALRLARFNAELGIPDMPSHAANFFTGVPAPAAAGLVLIPLYASFETDWAPVRWAGFTALVTVGVSALMVSRIPTFSGKRVRIAVHLAVPLLIGIAILGAFMTVEPWLTFLTVALAYLASIPFSIRSYRVLSGRRTVARANGTELA